MARRIDVREARRKTQAGEAVLVCAYEDEARCERFLLEGARTLADVKASPPAPDQPIIFYCA